MPEVLGKCLKKVVQKYRRKSPPPVSEVLNPLVHAFRGVCANALRVETDILASKHPTQRRFFLRLTHCLHQYAQRLVCVFVNKCVTERFSGCRAAVGTEASVGRI